MDQVHLLMATALSDGSGPAIMSMLFWNDLRNAVMTQVGSMAPYHGIQDPQDPQHPLARLCRTPLKVL